MKPIKNIVILTIFIFLIQFQKGDSQNEYSFHYERYGKANNFLFSLNRSAIIFNPAFSSVNDDLSFFRAKTGLRIMNGNFEWVYHANLISYAHFAYIPLIKNKVSWLEINSAYNLPGKFNTFLLFSYKGVELNNMGIYRKDYNWSSLGIDILYKDFVEKKFYSRFSYIVSVSTIENNNDFFSSQLNNKITKVCFDTKIENVTTLFIPDRSDECYRGITYGRLQLETYYRRIFTEQNQKEISINLKYNYKLDNKFDIYVKIGYQRYCSYNNWENIGSVNLGIIYRNRIYY